MFVVVFVLMTEEGKFEVPRIATQQTTAQYEGDRTSHRTRASILMGWFEFTHSVLFASAEVVAWFDSLAASLDCYHWFVDQKFSNDSGLRTLLGSSTSPSR